MVEKTNVKTNVPHHDQGCQQSFNVKPIFVVFLAEIAAARGSAVGL